MTGLQLRPVDTWFFRDGTPFTAQSAPQENVGSLFPPNPPTVVGAVRAALARANGWNSNGRWRESLCRVLGDGPRDLGALSFTGPFLLRDGHPLFRAPRHLLGSRGSDRWSPATFLRPGDPVVCDLGDGVRLPELTSGGDGAAELKPDSGAWLTSAGMNAVLAGRLPDTRDVVSSRRLWSDEPRIGLKRDGSTRTAKEGRLYSTRHVRLHNAVSLGVRIAGLPPNWRPPFGRLAPMGGENRLAECQQWNADLPLEPPSAHFKTTRKVALIALSPLDVEEGVQAGKKPLDDLGGLRVVSACLDRPQRVGGWDSLTRRPLPLRSVLPPGSVLFCEIADAMRFEAAFDRNNGWVQVGSRQELGFGLVAPGVWPDAT